MRQQVPNEPPSGRGLRADIILPGYSELSVLWEGAEAPFPSRAAADWMLRSRRQQMIDANAVALLNGRLYVHRERFIEVCRKDALQAYVRRYAEVEG